MDYISFEIHHNELHHKMKITIKCFFFLSLLFYVAQNFARFFALIISVMQKGADLGFSREKGLILTKFFKVD